MEKNTPHGDDGIIGCWRSVRTRTRGKGRGRKVREEVRRERKGLGKGNLHNFHVELLLLSSYL